MRVPVKLFGFILWLFSLNCAQCQECLQKDITYENIVPVAKASYNDSETVKVNCITGFTGMYKLKCEKGKWKTASERPCAKKKCSHPGDIENGDFKLKVGSEFVFGATVSYSCKKGFEMTSRINQRTCRAQGWDNSLPVCEAVKCPAIHTDGGVTATGNTEEAIYGDAVHFKCESTDKNIDGSSEIHCTETGKWSDPVPTCKDITCTVPEIKNGYVVEKMQEYRKDAILKYKCSKGFKLREGIPRCSKFGWTLKPECDEVICDLKSTTFGVEKIKPEGKTIFRAGESVEITCTGNYWFFFTKETIKSFKCKDEGKWDSDPVCEEIKCEVPHDQHVSKPYSYFRGDMKLGAKKYYSCMSDYEEMAAEATCTRDGWTPKPLCTVKMCAAPNIANADIVGEWRPKYKIYSRIQYKCHPGFEPEQPVQITCNYKTVWTGIQQCTEMCGPPPNVDFAEKTEMTKNKYSSGERVEYSCFKTYTLEEPYSKYLTCEQGQWRGNIKCLKMCGPPPNVDFAEKTEMTKNKYSSGERVEYSCFKTYTLEEPNSNYLTCEQGQWRGNIKCLKSCSVTMEEMNKRGIELQWGEPRDILSPHEDKISFVCQKGKDLKVSALRQTCNDGVMTLPECV